MKIFLFMAFNLLVKFHFETPPDPVGFPNWVANTDLKVYYDDASQAITAQLYDSAGNIAFHPEPLGPNLTPAALSFHLGIVDYNYQFCAATTLNYFTINLNAYPYVVRVQSPNSNVCLGIVCDLSIVNATTTPATGALNRDGTATITATTTHPILKYKANAADFDYDNDGQLSNIFTSLLPGVYIYVVKDGYLCKRTGVFVVGNSDTYAERWRSDFRDQKTSALHSLRIEDKLFVGAASLIKMDIAAAQVSWRGEAVEDSFNPVIASQLQAVLFSETDGQFVDLYTSDERRFKLKKYIDTGAGPQLQWVGYVTPMLYSEPYTESTNYSINVIATDGIGNLSNYQFVNDQNIAFTSRITYMEAISSILRKTGLQLNLKESVNLFETTMAQTAADSSLTQCTIDPDTYKDGVDGGFKTCLEVLKSLVSNLGCRLYMDDGIWKLDFIEQKSATSIAYRMFNYLGVYSSNGTTNPIINFGTSNINNRIVPYDNSVYMNITQNYGTFKFIYDLHIVNNFLRGGDMEVVDNTGSAPVLKGWAADISNGPGVSYGLEKLDKANRDSKYAAYFDFKNSPQGAYIVLTSDAFNYSVNNVANFALIFDVYTRPKFLGAYSFIDYEVRMGNGLHYLDNEASTTNDGLRSMTTSPGPLLGSGTNFLTNPEFNRVYIDENLTWKTIQINFTGSQNSLNGSAFVRLRIWGVPYWDFGTLSGLQQAPTADGKLFFQAPKARVLDNSVLRTYNLQSGADPTSAPDKIRPNDFGAGNSFLPVIPGTALQGVFWKLNETSSTLFTAITTWLRGILIDNVQLVYYPGGNPPMESVIYYQVTNPNIFNKLEKTFNHGDLPFNPVLDPQTQLPVMGTAGNPLYTTLIDGNYKYISKGHLELVNGTPTINWKRSYIATDNMPLVQLLQNLYMGQSQGPKQKLSGVFGYDLPVSFGNTFLELRTQKSYLPNSMTLNYADSSMNCEMLELKTGSSGPAPDLFALTTGFTTGFNA